MAGSKLHPHLKNFIRSVVLAEVSSIGPSKSYQWKETIMRDLQSHIIDNIEAINTKEDLDAIINSKIQELKQDMNKVLDMIGHTLKNVPVDVLKRVSKTNNKL